MNKNIEYSQDWLTKEIIKTHFKEKENQELKKELENFKNAWLELKDQQTAYITKFLDKFGSVETKTLNQLIKDLEQKHGIEVE